MLGSCGRTVGSIAVDDGFVAIMDEFKELNDDVARGFLEEGEANQILGSNGFFWCNFTDYAGSFAESILEFFRNADRQRNRFDFRHGCYGHSFISGFVVMGGLLDSRSAPDSSVYMDDGAIAFGNVRSGNTEFISSEEAREETLA
jgi:hypothetical protein